LSDDRSVPNPTALRLQNFSLRARRLPGDAGSEQMMTDPNSGGSKGVKLARFDLMPPDALERVAEVYGRNTKSCGGKYEDRNWERGYPFGWSFGAAQRHLWAFWHGEDTDPESGQHHLAHAAWHCLTMLAFVERGVGTDDRKLPRPPELTAQEGSEDGEGD